MKYNSTEIAPNGRIPTSSILGIVPRYVDCRGICRGIWFVRTGASIAYFCCVSYVGYYPPGTRLELTGARNPSQLPPKLNGTLMMNQMPTSANMVVSGTAPEEFS